MKNLIGKCVKCGETLTADGETLTADHVCPIAAETKPAFNKVPDMAETIMARLTEDHFTVGEGFQLLREVERQLQFIAYGREI